MRWTSLFGLGRVYKKLPPHANVGELGNNLEVLANYFLDVGSAGAMNNPGRETRWEWKLGTDLKMAVELMRVHIPDENYTNRPKSRKR